MKAGLQYVFSLIVVCCFNIGASAQDKITRKDGSVINAKILGSDDKYIRYKRFDNLEGPDYFLYRTDIKGVEYEKKAEPVTPVSKPEIKQQSPPTQPVATQPGVKPASTVAPELAMLEKQLARQKSKSTLYTAVGAGAVVGGIVTFVIVNGAYGTYKSQLEGTNTTFTNWYTQNYGKEPNSNDLAQPKGLIEFGSPGIYAAAAGVLGGAILTVMGRRNASLARQTRQELEQKRKQVFLTPLINVTSQLAGIQLKVTF